MAGIAALIRGVGIDRQLDGIEPGADIVRVRLVANVIEHEELGLGTEEHGVADAPRLDQALGLAGDAARVAIVGLAGGRLEHVAYQNQGGFGIERVDAGGGRIRHQVHVGLVDRLPAGDRGAIEHDAFGEGVFFDRRDIDRDVLPLAARIGKTEIDEFHVVVLDGFQDILSRRHSFPLCWKLEHGKSAGARRDLRDLRLGFQMASRAESPVRMRMASSMLETKILPSPMRPVCAARRMASMALSTISSPSTISIFTLGRKSTTYSAPR